MAKPFRIKYAGAVYHVTSGGNDRKKILPITKKEIFIATLSAVVTRYVRTKGDACHILRISHTHLLKDRPSG